MSGTQRDLLFGIDHIQLAAPAGCEQGAREFYHEILGLEEIAKPEPLRSRGGCWFRCGAQQIHIGVEADFRPARKAHPAIAVRDLSALRSRLAGRNIAVQDDESIPGTSRFYAHDPWGNRLEFVQAA
jgi:catechol 2,3-dioxygenase-like lactoylglutathione lyase family enzyme